jgi:hypothetical protein
MGAYPVPIHKWPIWPTSALCSKLYLRSVNHMPEVKFFASLDFHSICLFMADKIHTLTIDTFESAVEDEIRDVRILFFLTPHGAAGSVAVIVARPDAGVIRQV